MNNEIKSSKFGKVTLKQVRRKLKLRQEDLAQALETAHSNISDIETGKEIPQWLRKAIILNRLLNKAGYTFDDLILSLPDNEDC